MPSEILPSAPRCSPGSPKKPEVLTIGSTLAPRSCVDNALVLFAELAQELGDVVQRRPLVAVQNALLEETLS